MCCRGQQGQELLRKAISVCRQLPLAQLPAVVHQLLLWCSAAGLKAEVLLVSSDGIILAVSEPVNLVMSSPAGVS